MFVFFFKNNFYLDFFLKKLVNKFINTIFISTFFFFAEKYIIEFNSRYVFNYFFFNWIKIFKNVNTNHMYILILLIPLNLYIFVYIKYDWYPFF
jgi:hypothetical protein